MPAPAITGKRTETAGCSKTNFGKVKEGMYVVMAKLQSHVSELIGEGGFFETQGKDGSFNKMFDGIQ